MKELIGSKWCIAKANLRRVRVRRRRLGKQVASTPQ